MQVNYTLTNKNSANAYRKNNFHNSTSIISFSSKYNLKSDILRITTPKKGLVKHNSFLHPNLKAKTKKDGSNGVFATGKIKAGEIVCIFVGDILKGSEVKKLPEEIQCKTLPLASDIFQIGSKNPKDWANNLDAGEYFNHSCDPNLFLTGNNVLVARRKISKGEELCFDYATSDAEIPKNKKLTNKELDTVGDWACNCGSEKCREKVKTSDYQLVIPALVKEYGPKRAMDMISHYVAQIWKSTVLKQKSKPSKLGE